MKTMIAAAVFGLCSAPMASWAQMAVNPVTDSVKGVFEVMRGYVEASAEHMPEANYSFKPTPEVRSFGQLIGHIATSNNAICGGATGMRASADDFEQTMSAKADLVKAVKASFDFCAKAFEQMTDAKGAETVDFAGGKSTRIGVLAYNNVHDAEHYGNIVTYMRLKGLVPPSSQTPSQ